MDASSLGQSYIPSVLEKKRALSCFFFLWIVISLASQKDFSFYEYYYLSSSIWWRVSFSVIPFFFLFSFFVPLLSFFSLFLFLLWLLIWGVFVFNARNGVFHNSFSFFSFFEWIGVWLLCLFDIQLQK